MSIMSYPFGDSLEEYTLPSEMLPLDFTSFHPFLPLIFIKTQDNKIQTFNYRNRTIVWDIDFNTLKLTKFQLFENATITVALFFMEDCSVVSKKISHAGEDQEMSVKLNL